MGDTTFGQLFKRVSLYAPEVPVAIIQDCINRAYSRALSMHAWSGLRGVGEFQISAPFTTGTVSVVKNSLTVTGSGTGWTSALVGQQFFLNGRAPYYDVVNVETPTEIDLDRPWAEESASLQTYTIQPILVTCPADFRTFTSVIDVTNNWRLHLRENQEWLDRVDARRGASGTPWILATASTSPVTATLGRVRYELWPRGTGPKIYPFRYIKLPPLLSAQSDTLLYPIRGGAIFEGALAEVCLWPGTSQIENVYAKGEVTQRHRVHDARFLRLVEDCVLEDENIRQSRITYSDPWGEMQFAPIDAKWLQTHGGIFF